MKVSLDIANRQLCPYKKAELPGGDGVWYSFWCSHPERKRQDCPQVDQSSGFRVAVTGFPGWCPLRDFEEKIG